MPHAVDPAHRPRRDRAANRERLLGAYVELVAAGRRPGLDDVAAAAGVSRATAYRHFGTPDGLRVAAFLRALEDVGDLVVQAQRRSATPLRPVLEPVVAASLASVERFGLNAIERPLDDRRLNRAFERLVAPLAALLAERQAAGELTDALPARVLAEALISLVEAVSFDPQLLSGPAATDAVLQLFLDGAGCASPSRGGALA